jgi:hypothetical protein
MKPSEREKVHPMNATTTKIMAAACAAALVLLPASEAFARGGFSGGGFRSTPSFRSAPSVRSLGGGRASGWGSATKPSLKAPFAAGRSAGASPSLPRLGGSRASVSQQRGLYDSAKRNGTLFSSKAEASSAFRSRYAKDYSTRFASEPAARPSYIPSSYSVGGRSVNVVYNAGLGGYGYLHPILGTWILYDALSDAAMMDQAMSSRGYYYGGAPVYVSHGPSFLSIAFAILVAMLVLSAVTRMAARRRERY